MTIFAFDINKTPITYHLLFLQHLRRTTHLLFKLLSDSWTNHSFKDQYLKCISKLREEFHHSESFECFYETFNLAFQVFPLLTCISFFLSGVCVSVRADRLAVWIFAAVTQLFKSVQSFICFSQSIFTINHRSRCWQSYSWFKSTSSTSTNKKRTQCINNLNTSLELLHTILWIPSIFA